jgi:hypothetical protein
MKNKNLIICGIVVVLVGAGCFFSGMKYQQSKRSPMGQFGNVQGRVGGNRVNNFRPVNGEIISSDDKTITVKLQDGSSKIILYSNTTAINKAAAGTKEDLTNGTKVAVIGAENTDGSVTAQSIQLNPMMRGVSESSPSAAK